ncbi:hypothetical protein, partial [Caulobacter sp. HMWF025]|uniref:hypothetical protein n=1 Tax=Caulobacter sp. HMWF025 TaxID=2056860 RepID=UPI000D4F701C
QGAGLEGGISTPEAGFGETLARKAKSWTVAIYAAPPNSASRRTARRQGDAFEFDRENLS